MIRDDIHGVERAPEALAQYLLAKGGKNPHGEANYRLVWSPNRRILKGGRFKDWDKSLTAQERGGLLRLESGLVIPSHYKPLRTVTEVRSVRKYDFDAGWICEKWMPPAFYGGVDEWNARCVPSGERLPNQPPPPPSNIPWGGPYPTFGDYELCHYSPSLDVPSITELQNVIDRCERTKETHVHDVRQAVLERVNQWQEEHEREEEQIRKEHEAWMRDLLSPINSLSLEAGRHRNKLAAMAGITEHCGN